MILQWISLFLFVMYFFLTKHNLSYKKETGWTKWAELLSGMVCFFLGAIELWLFKSNPLAAIFACLAFSHTFLLLDLAEKTIKESLLR